MSHLVIRIQSIYCMWIQDYHNYFSSFFNEAPELPHLSVTFRTSFYLTISIAFVITFAHVEKTCNAIQYEASKVSFFVTQILVEDLYMTRSL